MKRRSTLLSLPIKLIAIILIFSTLLFAQESRVFFSGNEIISDDKINEILKTEDINSSIEKILDIYLNLGYPFAEILLDSSEKKGDASFYYLSVNENKKYITSNVKNSSSVKNSFLDNSMSIKNQLFSDQLVRKRLSDLSLYEFIESDSNYSVQISSDTSVEIITNVKQKKTSKISGTLSTGFDSMSIVGYLSLALISPFGYGDYYNLDYSRISYDKTDLVGDFEFPFIFATPVGIFGNGSFMNYDSTLSSGEFSLGFFVSLRSFKIKTGLGRTVLLYTQENDSSRTYSHIQSELSYRKSFKKELKLAVKNNLNKDLYAVLDFNSVWSLSGKRIEFVNLTENHYAFARIFEKQTGKYIGGNGNLKSYPEDFILAADYVFAEERILYAVSQYLKPGIFGDFTLFRTDKNVKFDSYLYSYGVMLQAGSETAELNIFYALNPELSLLQGRVHLTLSYLF